MVTTGNRSSSSVRLINPVLAAVVSQKELNLPLSLSHTPTDHWASRHPRWSLPFCHLWRRASTANHMTDIYRKGLHNALHYVNVWLHQVFFIKPKWLDNL